MTNDLANYPHYIEHLITLNVIFGILKSFIYNVTSNNFSVWSFLYLFYVISNPSQSNGKFNWILDSGILQFMRF